MVNDRMYRRGVLMLLLCFVASINLTFAQEGKLSSLVSAFDKHREKTLQEKIYLHLDRPAYLPGETMWFKVYYVDGTLHQPLDLSSIAYVELLDATQKSVLQAKVALDKGTGQGSLQLPFTLTTGSYLVRGYTNWMKNFSPGFYFEQQVTIVNTFQPLEKNILNSKPTVALQFFPEGGSLVNGIETKVAFKATDAATGKGVACEGEVLDQAGNSIATFKTLRNGIGQFVFTPSSSQSYTAVAKAKGATVKEKLPTVLKEGYSLQLDDTNAETVTLTLHATYQQQEPVYLLAHARQMKAVAKVVELRNGVGTVSINKRDLPDGITHFTFFNSYQKPVCERLYFTRPRQSLQISGQANGTSYSTRSKVTVNLTTKLTSGGTGTPANLSVAVYLLDSLNNTTPTDLASYLWLTADLKGEVEDPAYYLRNTTPEANQALDNVMLTHGWSRFKWEDVLAGNAPAIVHAPEYQQHLIQARILRKGTQNPAPGVTAFMSSPSQFIRFYNAVSGKNGVADFWVNEFYGPKELVIQTEGATDSTYSVQLLNPFSEAYSNTTLAQVYLPEGLRASLTNRHLATQAQLAYFRGYNNIFAAPQIDTTAFYGVPSQKYMLDSYTRFRVMEEVMREYVSGVQVRKRKDGFHFMVLNSPHKSLFQDNPLVLLDGVPVSDIDRIMAFDPLKVKRLDVMTTPYFRGTKTYSGLVSYSTYKGDLAGFSPDPHALLMEYDAVQQKREFYSPSYEKPLHERLPDYRNLLFWAPEVLTGADGAKAVIFYTSDLKGKYLVVMQGITNKGEAGYSSFTIDVQ